MWYRSKAGVLLAAMALAACGDEGTSPRGGGGAEDTAARFEQLADSVDGEGWSPTAEALRHAAKIVRLAGGATPVTLAVDGEARRFDAVGEQLDFPNIVCSWPDSVVVDPAVPEGDGEDGSGGGSAGECEQVGTWSMRTLIAWEPETMAEVVRIVADLGSTEVRPGVPDVMTGLPTNAGGGEGGEPAPGMPDSAVGEFPGFLGEYLVDDAGIYFAVEGTQSNDLLGSAGPCTEDTIILDWARFECEGARFRFGFDMLVDLLAPEPRDPIETHDLAMSSTEIAGVRLEVIEWVPPEPPPVPVDPPPVDSVPEPPPPQPDPVDPPPGPPPVDSIMPE